MNKKGDSNGPKIMIAAHMDEVEYIVQDIQDNGQIRLSMVDSYGTLTYKRIT